MARQGIRTSGRRLLSSASLAALTAASLWAGAAVAAEAPAGGTQVEELVVTGGFRGSLEQALNQKKLATVSADSILAEDIGKFPDLNLSESIQRIPGVALQRDAGEGREISVRGLGPQFTRVRINGMEALSTTGTSDANGGVNRGRAFDFNVFASDLFNSITVNKTAEAATEEGSLGATVDLRTARPFDYKGFTFVASGQEGYNDLSEKYNPRGAIMIANQTPDGTFGGLLSVAYNKRDTKDVGTSTVRWATGNAFAPGFRSVLPGAGITLAQADAAFHPRFPRFDDYTDHEERLGATGTLQWKPSDKTLFTFDALYADFKATREERYLEAPSFSVSGACTAATTANGSCGIAQTDVVSATLDPATNTITKGTFNNVDLRVEDRFDELDTKFSQFTLTGEHEFNDQWKADFVAGHARSDFTNPIQTTLTFDQLNVQGYSYDYTQGRVPLLSYGSANLTNPGSWILTQIRERPQTALNTYDNAQVNLYFTPIEAVKLSGGLDYKKYDYVTTEMRRSNGTTANQEAVVPAGITAIPLSSYSQVTTLNTKGLDAPAGTAVNWLVPNLNVANSLLSLYDPTAFGGAFRLGPEPALGNNNSVSEKDSGGYVQADWHTELGGIPFRGNVGVRYVKTEESASGFTFLAGAPLAITASREYSDTLPSLNMVLEPHENFLIRFAAAKVMARPNLGSLTPSVTVSVSGANHTVTAGNPNLDPFRGKAYDLSFEWYFNKSSLISLALFRKDIDSFVQTKQQSAVFHNNPFGIPDSVATAACGTLTGCDTTTTQWTFTVPVNTPGGPVDGFEINYQQAFDFLPGLLSHTGALINYTHVKSSIDYVNGTGVVVATNDLTGLSRESYNATLYYEDDRISTRISAAYRSKYLTRVPGQETGTDVDGTNSTFNLDASFQYTWNQHLKFTVEGINLTDEFQDQFNDSSNRVSFYHHTGREFLVGFRYTY
ncbi:TonB-dependent receptor [Phenylobacterium sp.]|uniref:TonB-dependent receptor n=1 Tax=Phenylobacterium sp. TaxID=1871053 RepID=UPI003563BFB0